MNTEENIESLDDTFVNEQPITNPETDVNNLEEVNDNPENKVSDVAPEPISVNEMINDVGPTDLQNTNIDSFGQDGMNINNMGQISSPTTLQDVGNNEEYNNIGMVPPSTDESPKPKKKNNKVLLILLAIILIGAIGYGVYFYLHMGSGKLKLKNIKVPLNGTISTNINDYIVSGKADSSCTSNFNDVLVNKVGTYKYKIICNSGTYIGTIEVVDEDSPQVVTKNVITKVGEEVDPGDFIESCSSEVCVYMYEDEDAVDEYIKKVGTYEVAIKVQDNDSGNTRVVKAYLIVIDKDITYNIVCTSESINGDSESYKIKDTLGIYNSGTGFVFVGVATREFLITYTSSEKFESDKAKIDGTGTLSLDYAKGKASYDSAKLTITITKVLTMDELKAEFSNFSDKYVEIRNIYNNDSRGFECITNSVKTN